MQTTTPELGVALRPTRIPVPSVHVFNALVLASFQLKNIRVSFVDPAAEFLKHRAPSEKATDDRC